jgi:hypothetical protein
MEGPIEHVIFPRSEIQDRRQIRTLFNTLRFEIRIRVFVQKLRTWLNRNVHLFALVGNLR